MRIEIIPSASRLVRSLRDIGYEFKDAIADIIDNSIEAKSTLIKIELNISTNNSTVIIADNGIGMSSTGVFQGSCPTRYFKHRL